MDVLEAAIALFIFLFLVAVAVAVLVTEPLQKLFVGEPLGFWDVVRLVMGLFLVNVGLGIRINVDSE